MAEKDVPRYESKNFREFEAANAAGYVLGCHGGKVINGVVHYPIGVKVDWKKAVCVQALIDYSYQPGRDPAPVPAMKELYGQPYVERFERLKNEPIIRRTLDGALHHSPGSFF